MAAGMDPVSAIANAIGSVAGTVDGFNSGKRDDMLELARIEQETERMRLENEKNRSEAGLLGKFNTLPTNKKMLYIGGAVVGVILLIVLLKR